MWNSNQSEALVTLGALEGMGLGVGRRFQRAPEAFTRGFRVAVWSYRSLGLGSLGLFWVRASFVAAGLPGFDMLEHADFSMVFVRHRCYGSLASYGFCSWDSSSLVLLLRAFQEKSYRQREVTAITQEP